LCGCSRPLRPVRAHRLTRLPWRSSGGYDSPDREGDWAAGQGRSCA
jgi:hypothetical protein